MTKPPRRVPLCAILLATVLLGPFEEARGGGAKLEAILPPDDVVFSDPARTPRTEVETTAALVPATATGPGLCFVESGVTLLSRALTAGGDIGALAPVALPPLGASESSLAIDNMLVRLRRGELLLIRQSQSAAEVTAPPKAAAVFSEWKDYIDGRRAVQALWRSSGQGRAWARLPSLDSALVLDGACGWPQEVDGKPWVGGWDRPEAYVDPWRGTVFLTIGCRSGTVPKFRPQYFDQELLCVSGDDGETWKVTRQLPRWEPVVMTTSADGRLYLAQAVGMDATSLKCHLVWLDSPYDSVGGEADVFHGDPSKPENHCAQLAADRLVPKVGQPNVVPPTLSRVTGKKGEHVVRLAYPAVVDGRQVEHVVVVRVDAGGAIHTTPGPTIVAEDPKGSVLQAVFVETDRVDRALDDRCDTALLYWMETAPSRGEMVARGALVAGPSTWSAPFPLSRAKGARRSWTPHGEWLGDYMKGAFAFDGKLLRFLAQWPESNPPNIDLHAVVVSVAP